MPISVGEAFPSRFFLVWLRTLTRLGAYCVVLAGIGLNRFTEAAMQGEFSDKQEAAQGNLQNRWLQLTILICRTICIGFALAETWSQLRFINEDGISYLDMSDVLITHNWHLLINPIWSPLYPFLIGVVTWLIRPAAQWETPVVHALNFVIFVGALASFEFLLRQVIRVLRRADASTSPLPVWAWHLLGYSLFAWSTIGMIWAPRMVTPDLCVAAFVYLDAGLLLSLRDNNNRLRNSLWLGITLGLGYLAKAILFPMAFVFMAAAFFFIGDWKKALRPVAVTFFLFCALSAPLLISMSMRVGRPSYSEAGSMNYVWHVNHFNPYAAAAAPFGPPAYMKHPMTILHRRPDVFAFREPVAYTYPPRQDMEYWSAGANATINPRDQLRAIRENLTVLFTDVHIVPMWGLMGMGSVILFMGANASLRFKNVIRSWPLLVPGVIGPCLFLLISVEPRYVAPFLALVLLGLLPGILVQNPRGGAGILTVVVAASVMVLAALLVVYHSAGFPRGENGEIFVQVGKALNGAGVRPGEDVALIGDSSDGCRWARVARVRIVAQVIREDVADFWRVDPRVQAEVFDAFARAGAKAVVAEETPPSGEFAVWQRLGDTHYYVHFLGPTE